MADLKTRDDWEMKQRTEYHIGFLFGDAQLLIFFNENRTGTYARQEIIEYLTNKYLKDGYRAQDIIKFIKYFNTRMFNEAAEKLIAMAFLERVGLSKRVTRYRATNPQLYDKWFEYFNELHKTIKAKKLNKAEKL